MADTVSRVTPMVVAIPRDEPYLGALRAGEEVNAKGYFVRRGNDTLYPVVDRSVLVRIECASGAVGWGETYGLVAPRATVEIIEDALVPFLIGADPLDRECIHDRLYDLIRVRGYTGGFYLDALAAIDIALWDLAGKLLGVSVARLLGGRRRERLPAYVSGLPAPNLDERVALAQSWVERGFDSFKFAAPMAGEGTAKELAGLRRGLGPDVRIACDMHWMHTAATATAAIRAMESDALWFAEAPVRTEDIDGLARVASAVDTPVAVGEEWRTAFDAQLRLTRSACAIVQPEVGTHRHHPVHADRESGRGPPPAGDSPCHGGNRGLPRRKPAGKRRGRSGVRSRVSAVHLREQPAFSRHGDGLPVRFLRRAPPGGSRRCTRSGCARALRGAMRERRASAHRKTVE